MVRFSNSCWLIAEGTGPIEMGPWSWVAWPAEHRRFYCDGPGFIPLGTYALWNVLRCRRSSYLTLPTPHYKPVGVLVHDYWTEPGISTGIYVEARAVRLNYSESVGFAQELSK
jgi:hypothetical protein